MVNEKYGNILNKCPICGAELEYGSYWQFTKYWKIGKQGKLLSRCIRSDNSGPMEASFITCVNEDFVTDCDLTVTVPDNSGIEITQFNDVFYWDYQE